MKRIPNARQIVRFALLATPAIWITLFAIEQSTEPAPMYTYKLAPIPAFTTDCYGCREEPQTALIDTLLPVAEGFRSTAAQFTVSSAYKPDSPDYSRYVVDMVLVGRMSPDEIDAHLRDAARSRFEDGAMSVKVVARVLEGPNSLSWHDVATLTFAPHGDWDRTDRIYDIDEYETVISHRSPDLTGSSSRTKAGSR